MILARARTFYRLARMMRARARYFRHSLRFLNRRATTMPANRGTHRADRRLPQPPEIVRRRRIRWRASNPLHSFVSPCGTCMMCSRKSPHSLTAPRAALRCVTARCNAAIAMLIPARSTSCSPMRLSPNVVVSCWVSLDRPLTGRCSRCVSSFYQPALIFAYAAPGEERPSGKRPFAELPARAAKRPINRIITC